MPTRNGSRPELGRDVLLFFEDRDTDTFVRGDRRLRRALRKTVQRFQPNKQRVSGFEVSFSLLRYALESIGQRVHVNPFALALANPEFPVGICGYSHILKHWTLPNPAVVGPGIYDHPKQHPDLLRDPRFASYIVLCAWMGDMFASLYDRDRLFLWFGGIDVDDWPDTAARAKDIDVLIYDKIRWDRERLEPELRQPILDALHARGLRTEIIRYGSYTHASYRTLLARSRSLLFLCEHETQGMAYQEAMASNVPVLAWDPGFWVDPNRGTWEDRPIPTTSVPYFSSQCGERFADLAAFPPAFERFFARLATYEPRAWVAEHLSPRRSAELYLRAYYHAAEFTNRRMLTS